MQIQRLGLGGFGSQILVDVKNSLLQYLTEMKFNFITFDEMICNRLLPQGLHSVYSF